MRMLVKKNGFMVGDFMATHMSKPRFERLKELNPRLLGEYEMLSSRDVDCTWWSRCFKKLTPRKIVETQFHVDYNGKVYEY